VSLALLMGTSGIKNLKNSQKYGKSKSESLFTPHPRMVLQEHSDIKLLNN
jgi:hypothetical protein